MAHFDTSKAPKPPRFKKMKGSMLMAPSRNQETVEQSAYLTTEEAAAELGVSTKTIQNWTNSDKIECLRTEGGHRRISKAEIDRIKELKGGNLKLYNVVLEYSNSKKHLLEHVTSFRNELDKLIEHIEEDRVEVFHNIFKSFDTERFVTSLSDLVYKRRSMNESI